MWWGGGRERVECGVGDGRGLSVLWGRERVECGVGTGEG